MKAEYYARPHERTLRETTSEECERVKRSALFLNGDDQDKAVAWLRRVRKHQGDHSPKYINGAINLLETK